MVNFMHQLGEAMVPNCLVKHYIRSCRDGYFIDVINIYESEL